MKETIRKALLLGIGSVYYSGKRLEKALKSFAKEHDLNKEEADKLISELLEKGKGFKQEQEKNIEKTVNELMEKANYVSKEEVEKLRKEIKDLKSELKSKK